LSNNEHARSQKNLLLVCIFEEKQINILKAWLDLFNDHIPQPLGSKVRLQGGNMGRLARKK
jgi:hypothetical protein